MGTTVTGSMSASLSANWSRDLAVGVVTAAPKVAAATRFTDGTGANKIQQVLLEAGSIAASGSDTIDLTGDLLDPGGATITFTKVKGFIIRNTSASGDGIQVDGTFNAWLKASGDGVKVMPGGFLAVCNPTADGYAVTGGSADEITLTNLDSVNAQTYEVEVIGETS